jgi:hypothetical protein
MPTSKRIPLLSAVVLTPYRLVERVRLWFFRVNNGYMNLLNEQEIYLQQDICFRPLAAADFSIMNEAWVVSTDQLPQRGVGCHTGSVPYVYWVVGTLPLLECSGSILGCVTSRNSRVRFEVFTAVTMKNGVFCDVTPCGS